MPGPRCRFLALAAALALSGCSYGNNLLDWATGSSPPATDASSASKPAAIPVAPSAAEKNPQPMIHAAPLAAAAALAPAPSMTFVGQKAQQLQGELDQFRSSVAQHEQALRAARQTEARDASTYFNTVAEINSRLQVGTTPGNPDLVAQWNQAQSQLDRMNNDIARLNTIANEASADSSFGNYLLNEVRAAFNLQGGVEADHEELRRIENQTQASLASVDQLLNSVSEEISRQSTYVANERNNLVTLALAIQNGQLYGPSLANRSFVTTPAPTPATPSSTSLRRAPRATATPRRTTPRTPSRASSNIAAENQPLVVIRFDRPNVAYQQPLYTAISRALERKPDATFTVMAVAPNAGTPAQVAIDTNASRQNAEKVLRTLTNMGLPANRVSLSATTSPDVQNNEVRIFVH